MNYEQGWVEEIMCAHAVGNRCMIFFSLNDTRRRGYLQIWPQRTSTHQGIMKDGW
jgi:hypothetical protein